MPTIDTTPLQQPLELAEGLKLSNRLIFASLTRNRAGPDPAVAVPNEFNEEYYRQRARGGFGLLLSEGTLVEPQGSQWRDAAGIWSDEQVEGWKKVTEAVHEEGSVIFCQLWHTGRVSHPDQPQQKLLGKPVRAPSAIGARGGKFHDLEGKPGYVQPEELPNPREVIEAYRVAAANAKKAGFDGVEVHLANGYLPHQFLDRSSNQRTDEFGGSVENRLRFAKEIFEAVLTVWPADRVGTKISPTGGYNDVGMNSEDTFETFTAVLDMISAFELAYVQPVRYLPQMDPELDPREGKRTRCQDFDIERKLVAPFREKQGQDGRKRRTLVFWNGAFGGKEYAGEEASAWVRDGRSDAIVIGSDAISNPDFPYRAFHNIPLQQPGGGDMKTWYAAGDGPNGRGKGYIDFPFCAELLKEKGEGNVRARV